MEAFSRFPRRFRIAGALTIALVVILSLAFVLVSHLPNSAHAAGDKIYRYGPFHTTNDPDSGTCGNIWATDSFDRIFTVNSNTPNEFNEAFINGQFVTTAGASPGACYVYPPPAGNGNTVGNGVIGNFHGNYENVQVSNGTFNPNAKCTQATCDTTAGFVATVYGPTATYNVVTFDFDYYTLQNGAWQNSSSDEGGNRGDITGPSGEPDAPTQISIKN